MYELFPDPYQSGSERPPPLFPESSAFAGRSLGRRLDVVPRIRGTAVLSLRDFLENRFGFGAFAETADTAPLESHAPFAGLIQPMAWYSTADFIRIIHAARDHFLWPHLPEAYGEAAAEYELTVFHRFVLHFASPAWLLRRGAEIWRTYHNTGNWLIEASSHRLRGTLSNFGIVDGMYCRVLVGWFRRAGELTGARTMHVLHPHCRATGAPACVFTGDW